MTLYLSNRDGDGKTSEEGHYKFQTSVFSGNVLGSTALQVTQNSPTGMSVLVLPGQFKIDTTNDYAYTGWNTANLPVTISTADPANPRITSIVAWVDKGASTSPSPPNNPGIVKISAINGTPTSSPVAPSGTTIQTTIGSGNPYIILANITVGTGATSIVNANISDQRIKVVMNSNLVNENSILDNSITENKIASNSVTENKIADNAVTSDKVLDSSLSDEKWTNGIAFYAYRNTTNDIASSTFVKFSCDSIVYNYGNGYSNASDIGRFTAPVTGIYFFSATLNTGNSGSTRSIIEIRTNGSTARSRVQDFTGGTGTVTRLINGQKFAFLNAGDYIEPWAWSGAAVNIASGQAQVEFVTDFGGYLVTRI